jgi:Ca2+-binding EF-hand superfamily protein
MKVRGGAFLSRFHLDTQYYLLTGRAVQLVKEYFDVLDSRCMDALDDLQFNCFMRNATDLNDKEILCVFDMLDVDDSGSIEFDEFYLLVCMLIAIKDGVQKNFLWCHSRTCFELLDEDGSKSVSIDEFATFGVLFSITRQSAFEIFKEFDMDDSKALDYDEFRLFALACIDAQNSKKETESSAMSVAGAAGAAGAGGESCLARIRHRTYGTVLEKCVPQ